MSPLSSEERTRAENLLAGLSARLNAHTLWDVLTLIVPPVLAFVGTIFLMVQSSWLTVVPAAVVATLISGLAALAILLYYRSRKTQLEDSAALLDQRAGANEHFLTLATIDRVNCPQPLLSRLQRDAEHLSDRIELKRDFPYKIKKSTYWSAAASLLIVWLLYFLLPPSGALTDPGRPRLRQIAEQMAHAPQLKPLAERLKALATKLDDAQVPEREKLSAVQDAAKKVAEEQKVQQDEKNRQMLSQAAGELKQTEQQLAAGGREQQDSSSEGGGNVQSNLPKEGEGGAKQSQGSGDGDGQGKMGAQANKDMAQGKTSQPNPNEPGPGPAQDKTGEHQGPMKGDQPDPNRAEKESDKQKTDSAKAGPKEGSGKPQSSDQPPQMASPAERFYKAGEGKEEIKGARYVTVQLPEDVVADAKAESKATKAGTGGRTRTQVPVSNVPLPPHVPNAPAEKQPMPLEYRGIIR